MADPKSDAERKSCPSPEAVRAGIRMWIKVFRARKAREQQAPRKAA